jgi:ribosomal protein S18 acetylase RimI-like enzyme
MYIRTATLADEPAVTALWRSCNLVTHYNDPATDFRFALAGPSSEVILHEDETGQVDGSVMVGHDGHRGWLYYVATSPAARRSGLGRAMVEAAEQWLRKRGVSKAQLLVRQTNPEAVTFYEHLGFEVGQAVVMGKWLK